MTTKCVWCDEEDTDMTIANGQQPIHNDCLIRMAGGGINHLLQQCQCCGGNQDPDPQGISRRDAARLAANEVRRRQELREEIVPLQPFRLRLRVVK